jgi:hypothetical protein
MVLFQPLILSTARRFIALLLTLCLALIPVGAAYAQPPMYMDMNTPCDQCADFSGHGSELPCEQNCVSKVCVSTTSGTSLLSVVLRVERRDLPAQKLFSQARLRYQSPDSSRLIRPPIA